MNWGDIFTVEQMKLLITMFNMAREISIQRKANCTVTIVFKNGHPAFANITEAVRLGKDQGDVNIIG